MVANKRSKISRVRGSHTHGGGAMKKRRGAGNRGGRGKAGSGKRGDAKKPSYWKNTKYFGKRGFKSINKKEVKSINLVLLSQKLDAWVESKLAEKKGSDYTVDLSKLGFQKLLASGNLSKKVTIHVNSASQKAIDKVKKVGGDVVLLDNK